MNTYNKNSNLIKLTEDSDTGYDFYIDKNNKQVVLELIAGEKQIRRGFPLQALEELKGDLFNAKDFLLGEIEERFEDVEIEKEEKQVEITWVSENEDPINSKVFSQEGRCGITIPGYLQDGELALIFEKDNQLIVVYESSDVLMEKRISEHEDYGVVDHPKEQTTRDIEGTEFKSSPVTMEFYKDEADEIYYDNNE